MTRRYTRILPDGQRALPTNIEYLVTFEDLMAGVAHACVTFADDPYRHRLEHHDISGEEYWSQVALDAADQMASTVGRRPVWEAVRRQLRGHGEAWTIDHDAWRLFPREIAERRAAELWPMLEPGSPFARAGDDGDDGDPPPVSPAGGRSRDRGANRRR